MAIVNRSTNRSNKFRRQSKKNLIPVRVLDIILDENHPKFSEYGEYDSIGTIIYSEVDKNITKEYLENPNIARPLHSYLKYYPLINEIVLILTTADKTIYSTGFNTTYYLPTVNIWNHPHHNALPNINDLRINEADQQADYEEIESGIIRRPKDGGTDIELGQYFNEQDRIKPLLPFEGDTIIEGRFGNSIRFGSTTKQSINNWSFSDPEYIGSPITIIRNGQTRNVNNESWRHTTEDLNTDASSIYLTSDQSIANFKTAGIATLDELTISWPSFGQPEPDTITEIEIEETNIEDLSEDEVQEIVQGDEEITELTEETGDITIIEQLPETEEEENSSEIAKYVNSVFGKFIKLPLLAGTDRLFAVNSTSELLQQADGEFRKVYYPLKINSSSPTSEITAQKLIEIMSYYKIKPAPGKLAFYAGFSKSAVNANLADEYFRAHYLPVANSIHVPSYKGYMNLYKDAVANEFVTEEELDYRIRVQILDDIWAEVAHAADIDLNGVGGYLKDDIGGTVGDWFKKLFTGEVRRKDKDQPEAVFIPENYANLNPEDKTFSVRISDEPAAPGDGSITIADGDVNVKLDFVNVPGRSGDTFTFFVKSNPFGRNIGPNRIFKSNSYLNIENVKTIKRFAEEILVNELGQDPIILKYVDLSLIGDGEYDNLAHYEGRTHNLVEPQLESIWLTDYSADDDLAQGDDVEAVSESKSEAEAKYEELALAKGISTPPKKYYNQATGEYIIKDKEISLPEGDTIEGEGKSIDQATAQRKARRDAEQKANQLGARVGALVKATPSKLGDQFIYRATYILIKPE
jgi:hypothetical protein|tara:strand:- start:1645 stop:4065 length:2421 start_codon:yes stop_codon:yes gene_type:complete